MTNDMLLLEVGKRYPDEKLLTKLKELGTDGCTFNPFLSAGVPAPFYIHLTDITEEEVQMFNNGKIFSALDVTGGGLVMTFIVDTVTYECPINMHYLRGKEEIPEIENDIRMAATLVAIESRTGEIKAVRAFTLHPLATAELIVRAKHQLQATTVQEVDKANTRLIVERIKYGVADDVMAWEVGI